MSDWKPLCHTASQFKNDYEKCPGVTKLEHYWFVGKFMEQGLNEGCKNCPFLSDESKSEVQ